MADIAPASAAGAGDAEDRPASVVVDQVPC